MKTIHKAAMVGLTVWFSIASQATAQERFPLRGTIAAGDQCRVGLDMKLTGEVYVRSGDKTITMNLKAQAQHAFPERVLHLNKDGEPDRVARFYEQARADITVHKDAKVRQLREDRRLIAAARHKDETVTFALGGPLTREELELTGEHLDVLAIHGLMAPVPVLVGETWKVSVPIAQALIGLDAVIEQDLQGKLEEVKDGLARVTVSGSVSGIITGAELKADVNATCWFDVKNRRLMQAEWKQKDDRKPGPASSESRSDSTTVVKWTYDKKSDQLADAVVANVPEDPEQAFQMLVYVDPKGRCEFLYDRAWRVAAQRDDYTVFRLLDRGELVAQLNVTPMRRARAGEHISADEFKKQVEDTPGLTIGQFLQSEEVKNDDKNWVYRLSLVGTSNELQVLQNHYVVAGPQGDQVIFSFTTEVSQQEKLGARDLALVGTVKFPRVVGLGKPVKD